MRLIDADALMQTYAKFVAPSNNSDFEKEPTWNDAVSLLESAPTVAVAVVEVVRCKDCRFFEDEDYYGNCYCEEWGNVTNANGYCHDAERRK